MVTHPDFAARQPGFKVQPPHQQVSHVRGDKVALSLADTIIYILGFMGGLQDVEYTKRM